MTVILDTNIKVQNDQATLPNVKSNQLIHVQQLGEHINIERTKTLLEHTFFCQQFKDALYVSLPKGHIFIFDYGLMLCWSVSSSKQVDFVGKIAPFTKSINKPLKAETWQFTLNVNVAVGIRDDVISIPNKEVLTLLSVSHALAQSAILEYFEVLAQQTIIANDKLTQSLAATGTIPLSRKALSKERGKLFKTKSNILLHFKLLDTPEFFWQYPEQESTYKVLSAYLELRPRVELLNLKLSTISELLDMLATEQHHKHSAFLEWIIIILIAVDIVVYFVGD
jgi:uncharacterized Rmd1/YagE family protein